MRWEPAAKHLRPDRQQVGDEAVWVEESADERESEAKGDWTLDHPPVFQFQVSLYFEKRQQRSIHKTFTLPKPTDSLSIVFAIVLLLATACLYEQIVQSSQVSWFSKNPQH